MVLSTFVASAEMIVTLNIILSLKKKLFTAFFVSVSTNGRGKAYFALNQKREKAWRSDANGRNTT